MKPTSATACFAIICLILALTSGKVNSQQSQGPIYKDRLLEALREGKLPQETLIREVKKSGVNFEMTQQDEDEFKKARALPELIQAIKENFRRAEPSQSKVETSQSSEVACKTQSEIILFSVSKETDAKQLVSIKRKLVELGYTKGNVKGPWPNKNPSDRPETSEIRYFYDEDERCAEQVGRDVEEAFSNVVVEPTKGVNPNSPPPKHTLQLYLK